MTKTQGPGNQAYEALNAMRGVAALAVVLYHGKSLLGEVAPAGYLAVDFFFLLSGFVVAHAYRDRLQAGLGVAAFARVRVIRFYPLYALGLGLGLLFNLLLTATGNSFALSPPLLAFVTAATLLFIPVPLALRDQNLFPLNVPSWSLFFELAVNMVYAATLRWQNRWSLVATILLSAAVLMALTPADGLHDIGVNANTVLAGSARTLLSFAAGVLLRELRPGAPRTPLIVLLMATAACFLFLPAESSWTDLLFVLFASPVLVWLGTGCTPPEPLRRFAALLGAISFPIYAIHRPVLMLAESLAKKVPASGATIGWLTVALLVVASALLARFYDPQARARLSRCWGGQPRRDPAEAAAP